jgi:hypothetical protein
VTQRSRAPFLVLLGLSGLAACERPSTGGITAHIEFPDIDVFVQRNTPGIGMLHRGLRSESVPAGLGRLQIVALDVVGSTLAETNLYAAPERGQLPLAPQGGTWSIDRVPIGKNRQVAGHAFLPSGSDPMTSNLRVLDGRITGIEVRSGETVNAGVLKLDFTAGVRYPPIDFDAPDAPIPTSSAVPNGNALLVTFDRPPQSDVAGYAVAIGDPDHVSTPTIARQRQLEQGDVIGDGVTVRKLLLDPDPRQVLIDGLTNGRTYTVLVYAFDGDQMGRALNYSRPGLAFGTPRDTNPPGPIRDLVITARTPTSFDIGFIAPGEDNDIGLPASYELRVAGDQASLQSPSMFEGLPAASPPPVAPPGSQVMFARAALELGVVAGQPFFIGIRAVDDSGNDGPIATASFTGTSSATPQITALLPEIVLAGGELRLEGQRFGITTATVTLTYTTTHAVTVHLAVDRWSDDEVRLVVPVDVRSGTVALTRADGKSTSTYLPVLQRFDMVFGSFVFPFELLAAPIGGGSIMAALYHENDTGSAIEGAIERTVDQNKLGAPVLPYDSPQASTAIGGTYAPQYDRFFFIASNSLVSMTAAFVSTSTLTPVETRVASSVIAGGADRVAVAALDGGAGGAIPAMLAFSLSGVVRAATVADALTEPFNRFTAFTSSAGGHLDSIAMKRSADGELLMAYRSATAHGGILIVRRNQTQRPSDFNVVPAASAPASGPGIEILAVPAPSGDQFVIAYEAIDTNGVTDIRLMRLSDYGQRLGYAPLGVDTAHSRRLEDAGLVLRQGQPWIAILASTPLSSTTRLEYTEVRLSDLDAGDDLRGEHPGAVLDSAPMGTRGRLGCKGGPLASCPIVWLGTNGGTLFLRR